MTQSMIVTVLQEAVMTVLKCAMPMLIAAMVIGVVISVFQSATQINEQTLSFVPKIVGVFLIMLVFMGYIISQASELTIRLYGYVNQMIY